MSETINQEAEWAEEPKETIPLPRKRGRPKKIQTLNPENETGSLENSDSDVKPKQKRGRQSSIEKDIKLIDESLSSMFGVTYVALLMVNQVDADIIQQRSPQVVKSVCNVARVDSKFREFLVKGLSASVYGELAFSIFLLIMPILANHNLLPPSFSFFGPSPSVITNGYGNS